MQEDKIIIDDYEGRYKILEEQPETITEATIEVIKIDDVETFYVDTDEAFSSLDAPNEQFQHQLLMGRDAADQHPILSITGLREELDDIQSLKTVCSDKKQLADYYEWEDGNIFDENRVGYFVSLCEDTRAIKICTGGEMFGITIDSAAFIGGQDDISRGHKYGLVIYAGVADVRCELGVGVGNRVMPNNYGMAKKTAGGYGYKVVAIHNKHDVRYATISLNSLANQIGTLSEDLSTSLEHIGNVANEAYNKASESANIAEGALKDVLEAVDTIDVTVSYINERSVQAKAIAESVAVSAENIRNEVAEFANNTLEETSNLRKEFEARVDEIDVELGKTEFALEETKRGFNATIDSLRLDTEGQLADFKKEVKDNYATTTQLVAVKTENADIVAALKQEASDTYATVESVASLKTETSEALAGLKQEVTDTYATQEMLTSLETESSKALTDYKQEVTNTYATQEMVSKLETDTSKVLTDYKQEVTNTYATQEIVSKLETDTSKALTDYKQEVTDTYATQTSLTTLRTDTTNAIAASEEKATETFASKSDLTSFETDTVDNMARVEQKADANGASINSIVSSIDKYSVGEYSQTYGLTQEQAQSILKEGMIYIPIGNSHSEKYGDLTQNFSSGYYYEWNGTQWVESSSNAVIFSNIKPENSDYQYWYINSDTAPAGYEPYVLYIYETEEWKKVNILNGNTNNRITSMIRQEANRIALDIVNAQSSVASHQQWLDENSANIQDVVSWKSDVAEDVSNIATIKQTADTAGASIAQVVEGVGKDGEVNAASIVAAVNESDSSVVINADHIQFEGFVSFASKNDVKDVRDNAVYNTKVEYALSSSSSEFIAVSDAAGEWATTAPVWRDGTYMWQQTTITRGDNSSASTRTCIQGADGKDGVDGKDGTQGYSIVASVSRPSFTETQWDVYGTIGRSETWSDTSSIRNGCRIGDIFTVVGTATDTGNAHTLYFRSTTASGNLVGSCLSHSVAYAGKAGANGAKGNDGISIVSVAIEYAKSTSNTTEPTTGWTTNLLSLNWTPSNYIWSREVITYSNNTTGKTAARVDKALSVVAGWCSSNNETYIDGSKIYTGSITSTQLNTDAITSLNYVANTSGSKLDLQSGTFDSKNFKISATGKVEIRGDITTTDNDGIASAELNSGKLSFYHNNVLLGNLEAVRNVISLPPILGGLTWDIKAFNIRIPESSQSDAQLDAGTLMFSHGSTADYIMTNVQADGITYADIISNNIRPRHRFYGGMMIDKGLYVQGEAHIASSLILSNNVALRAANTSGTPLDIIRFGSGHNLVIGYGLFNTETTFGNGDVYIYSSYGMLSLEKQPNDSVTATMRLRPGTTDTCVLGGASYRWHTVYTTRLRLTETSDTSDRRLKKNITALSDIHSELFDRLQPVQYEFIDRVDRIHYGLIAQDVEASMVELGIGADDLGLVRHEYYVDETTGELVDEYGLGYNNLISMLIHEVQKLKKEIKTLKGE